MKAAREVNFGDCQLWTRVNSLDSPWALDDITRLVTEIGDRLDVMMIPKVEGPWDIHYVDQLLAQLEAKAGLQRPVLLHAILETAQGVTNVEEIFVSLPAHAGPSFGPADLCRLAPHETTRVAAAPLDWWPPIRRRQAARERAQDLGTTRGAHGGRLHRNGISPTTAVGAIDDPLACEDQFRAAFLLGCVGAWSLHPSQVEIARKVFSPAVDEVRWARRVIAEMGDGTGAVMLEGKMQDDATVKQCRVMVGLAKRREEPQGPAEATASATRTEGVALSFRAGGELHSGAASARGGWRLPLRARAARSPRSWPSRRK